MDSRLMVGSRRPDLFEDFESEEHSSDESNAPEHAPEEIALSKRKLEMPLTEACPSVTEWLSLNKSRDIHDQEVEIFQPSGTDEEARLGAQFFYSTRCVKDIEDHPCTGTSFLYNSKCLTRRGYVMALVRKKPDEVFDWNWIQVSASCNCGISKKF